MKANPARAAQMDSPLRPQARPRSQSFSGNDTARTATPPVERPLTPTTKALLLVEPPTFAIHVRPPSNMLSGFPFPASASSSGASSPLSRRERALASLFEINGKPGLAGLSALTGDGPKLAPSPAFHLSANLGLLAAGLKIELVPSSDARIADDPIRASSSSTLTAAHGHEIRWLEATGKLDAGLGLSATVPVGGPATVTAGFEAQAGVSARVFVPVTKSGEQLPRDQTLPALPTSAVIARMLAAGSEVELRGAGHAMGKLGVGVGTTTEVGPLKAGVGLQIGGEVAIAGEYAIAIRRGEGAKVGVTMQHILGGSVSASLRGAAEAALDIESMLPGSSDLLNISGKTTFGSSLLIPAELTDDDVKIDIRTITSGEEPAAPTGARATLQRLKTLGVAEAHVDASLSHRVLQETRYEMDLDTPGGVAAYDGLVHLNESVAGALALEKNSGVERIQTRGKTTKASQGGAFAVAGKKLFLKEALRGTSDTTTERNGFFVRRFETRLDKVRGNVFTGDKHSTWEIVQIMSGPDVTNGAKPDVERFFLFTMRKKEKAPREDDVAYYARLADALGVTDAEARSLDLPDTHPLARLVSSKDDIEINIDFYFTDDGLNAIAESSSEDVRGAYAMIAAQLDPELGNVPVNDTCARALANGYDGAPSALLTFSGLDKRPGRASYALDYNERTGRELPSDAHVFREAQRLADIITPLGPADAQGWDAAFQGVGQASGFDSMTALGALAQLAGRDNTLLRDFRIQGKTVNLRAVDEVLLGE